MWTYIYKAPHTPSPRVPSTYSLQKNSVFQSMDLPKIKNKFIKHLPDALL